MKKHSFLKYVIWQPLYMQTVTSAENGGTERADFQFPTLYCIQRSQSMHLQQPYLESDQNTVGPFLFDKEKKELLFTICVASLQNSLLVGRNESGIIPD